MSQSSISYSSETNDASSLGQSNQAKFWSVTIPLPCRGFPLTSLPKGLVWIRGQHELSESGYLHVQAVAAFQKKTRFGTVRRMFGGTSHWEPTRSAAINDYVWKEDTRVEGTQFEFGAKPIRVNSKVDWEAVWRSACNGDLDAIEPRIRIVSYRTLRAIAADHQLPRSMERTIKVYWGKTGSGKSFRAWDEAGDSAYVKCPRSKFWEGYQGQENVVIDEFRGGIDVAHLLRWFDRYPVIVEVKGASRPLNASRIWVTSNLNPESWYPELDQSTLDALLRRLEIVEMNESFVPE